MPATDAQLLLNDAQCFICLGMSIGDALLLAELDTISQNINPAETFYILSQVGDILAPQAGDRFVWQ